MKRKGFTLVELLVVIAIIALLISILAPSLNAAKNLVRQVMCQTNLKSLGTSLNLYAEANKGLMLPGYWFEKANNPGPQYQNSMCLAYGASDPAADGYLATRHTIGWANILEVWKPADLMYCPSLAASGLLGKGIKATDYPQPWGTKNQISDSSWWTQYIRITYIYNPHVRAGNSQYLYSQQLAQFPSNMPTLTDLFWSQYHWGHQMSGVQWFMVFPDSHVGFKSNQKAVELVKGLDAYNGPWPDYTTVYDEIF